MGHQDCHPWWYLLLHFCAHHGNVVFPCVSVQDIFLPPLLIFHGLILDSFKDQQHLLQPVFSPWRGHAKPTAECLAWKTPRRERGVWEENRAFEAENFLATGRDWAAVFLSGWWEKRGRKWLYGVTLFLFLISHGMCSPCTWLRSHLKLLSTIYFQKMYFHCNFSAPPFFLHSRELAGPSTQEITVEAARVHSIPCVDKHSQGVLLISNGKGLKHVESCTFNGVM